VSNTTPTIACLGQASIDTIRKGKKTVRGLLGGAAVYSATVAARLHARVGICALIGSDFPPKFVEFISAQGVGISGLHQRRGASTRITLVYQGQRLKGVSVKTGVSRHLESLHIPLSYRTCRFFHVCPSPYKTQLNTTLAMKKRGAHVSLDPHADFNNARFELVSKSSPTLIHFSSTIRRLWRSLGLPQPRTPLTSFWTPGLHLSLSQTENKERRSSGRETLKVSLRSDRIELWMWSGRAMLLQPDF
jgi:sugar/nucleoside kinase (ribokinase family)